MNNKFMLRFVFIFLLVNLVNATEISLDDEPESYTRGTPLQEDQSSLAIYIKNLPKITDQQKSDIRTITDSIEKIDTSKLRISAILDVISYRSAKEAASVAFTWTLMSQIKDSFLQSEAAEKIKEHRTTTKKSIIAQTWHILDRINILNDRMLNLAKTEIDKQSIVRDKLTIAEAWEDIANINDVNLRNIAMEIQKKDWPLENRKDMQIFLKNNKKVPKDAPSLENLRRKIEEFSSFNDAKAYIQSL